MFANASDLVNNILYMTYLYSILLNKIMHNKVPQIHFIEFIYCIYFSLYFLINAFLRRKFQRTNCLGKVF